MQGIKALTLGGLMQGHGKAQIICLMKREVVRTLEVKGDDLLITSPPDSLLFSLNQRIFYDPWMMDRGSLLIQCKHMPDGMAKLCTEADIIRYEDGSEFSILPSDNAPQADHEIRLTESTPDGPLTTITRSDPGRDGIF
jgi:hypothetical protein